MSSDLAKSSANNSTFGGRLREERERLGLTQEQLARAGKVHRRTQVNYEADERSPDAAYINLVASAGVDTWYVLHGVRSEFLEFLNSWASAFILELLAKLGYTPDRAANIVLMAESVFKLKTDEAVISYPTQWEQFNDRVFEDSPVVVELRKPAELDAARLQAVLAFVDSESTGSGIELSSAKRAQLAASLYRNAFKDGALDEALGRDLFRLSAPGA